MNRIQTSILALTLSALPLAAPAQEMSQQILSCNADRNADGCAELLMRVFVCERAEAMTGCAEVLEASAEAVAAREAATAAEMAEAEAAAASSVAAQGQPDDGEEFVSDTKEVFDVEVRAEGEATDEAGPDADEPGADPEAVQEDD